MQIPLRARACLLLAIPAMLMTASAQQPVPPDCARDLSVGVSAGDADRWSSYGGEISFGEEKKEPFVRLEFLANPEFLRFDQDASLRALVDFACRPGERPLALTFEVRFSETLRFAAEMNDVMLLGKGTQMLAGAGVPQANEWYPVRLAIPPDAIAFHALHFGVGSAWVRERSGQKIAMDLRRVQLERRSFTLTAKHHQAPIPAWRDPDDPEQPDPRIKIWMAAGAPAYLVADFKGESGSLRIESPKGMHANVWVADWIQTEQKPGVVSWQPIRLLQYGGEHLPSDDAHPRRFWVRLGTTASIGRKGIVRLRFAGASVTMAVEALPVEIPVSPVQQVMYYQMNEGWSGYQRYAEFYRNASAHFSQLATLGFTGIHLAEEPTFTYDRAGKIFQADYAAPGRYWQRWPLSLGELLASARAAGLMAPVVWEGLRVFERDAVWNSLFASCGGETLAMPAPERMATLAAAGVGGWPATESSPYLSVGDEPGVHSMQEVRDVGERLVRLRAAGYRTYLTTHARLHDSFHKLAPVLDINALHAEDVTSGAFHVPAKYGGTLWLYNGGGFNVAPPGHDRFFAGVYGWGARATGAAQWIYTRPSSLADPLDLRTRLRDDAQFYALPGRKNEPAATPGLLGLAAGITDRNILEYAAQQATKRPELSKKLEELRASLQLPSRVNEFTPARARERLNLHEFRAEILRALALP